MLWLVLQSALLATVCSAAQPHFSAGDDFPTLGSYASVATPAPVVGVLTQPTPPINGTANLYIAASYVKYAEAGGARVVPVFSDRSREELTSLFSKLNGLLVPGTPFLVSATRFALSLHRSIAPGCERLLKWHITYQ